MQLDQLPVAAVQPPLQPDGIGLGPLGNEPLCPRHHHLGLGVADLRAAGVDAAAARGLTPYEHSRKATFVREVATLSRGLQSPLVATA